ncbi:MAG TPA: hypothetical protein VKU37_00855 [Verrucomicrobiae bacterium]|nr:hypothetical protein [Verrucomicrobiae bacterium]
MPIGPVSTHPREISVAEPVSPALEQVKRVLFRPFDLGKWFTIGFCAWLAQLGESGSRRQGDLRPQLKRAILPLNAAADSNKYPVLIHK